MKTNLFQRLKSTPFGGGVHLNRRSDRTANDSYGREP